MLLRTFDDVLLEPQYSELKSRSEADPSTEIMGLKLKAPILSANMDTITEFRMALAMNTAGGLGVLHRYAKPLTVCEWIGGLNRRGAVAVPSIGVQPEDIAALELYIGAGARHVCIDIAHGDCLAMVEMIKYIKSKYSIKIMAGNVATRWGARRLFKAGADVVKAGVGGGSLCTTRLVTGHGVPQLHAIMECAPEGPIVADGGLRHSGDIVKALAAGAKAVMVGSLLAGTEETPGGELNKPRQYRGMASEEAQLAFKGAVQNGIAEGVAKTVPHKGSVWPVIQALLGGIRSGMSYSGARTLQELRECARFIDVSTNTLIENHPHGKNQ